MSALAAVLLAACVADPDSAAVRLAALTAGSAIDALDDLQAVDDPDAAGVRDRFRDATREALEAARLAHATAPAATADAYARSLEASDAAQRFGDAMALALEARGEYEAAAAAGVETLTALQAVVRIEATRELRAKHETALHVAEAAGDHYGAWTAADAALDASEDVLDALSDGPPSVLEALNASVRRILDDEGKGWSADALADDDATVPRHVLDAADAAGAEVLIAFRSAFRENAEEAIEHAAALSENRAAAQAEAEAAVDEAIAAFRAAAEGWSTLATPFDPSP